MILFYLYKLIQYIKEHLNNYSLHPAQKIGIIISLL